jgi:hypothetical protein
MDGTNDIAPSISAIAPSRDGVRAPSGASRIFETKIAARHGRGDGRKGGLVVIALLRRMPVACRLVHGTLAIHLSPQCVYAGRIASESSQLSHFDTSAHAKNRQFR